MALQLFNQSEEVRNDFLVTSERKKIWACLLEMLELVDRICRHNNIPYFAIGGTLLGAVRHGGFIPWDDDLDIAMLRNDYNRFLEVAQKELTGKFFLQTTLTDQDYYREHARIRNSDTTGICEHYEMHKCNNGIYLDILPLENYNETLKGKIHSNVSRFLGRILNLKVHFHDIQVYTIKNRVAYIMSFLFPLKLTHRFREWLETTNARYATPFVTLGDVYYYNESQNKLTYRKEAFSKTIMLGFENMMIPVPVDYDSVLSTEYGDYMRFPPPEKRGVYHSIIFDPNTPYQDYIRQHFQQTENT